MILDLTLPINEKMPVFPGDTPPTFEITASSDVQGWNTNRFTLNSHSGTHIDAPYHFLKEGKRLTDFPPEKFVGEAVVIDYYSLDMDNPDLSVVKEDDIVLFYTGHARKIYDSDYYSNNPVLNEKIANILIEKKIKIVGLDSFTPDNPPYTLHVMFFNNDIMILENLINLNHLVGKRFMCVTAPLKLDKSDGAPCRVFAVLDNQEELHTF